MWSWLHRALACSTQVCCPCCPCRPGLALSRATQHSGPSVISAASQSSGRGRRCAAWPPSKAACVRWRPVPQHRARPAPARLPPAVQALPAPGRSIPAPSALVRHSALSSGQARAANAAPWPAGAAVRHAPAVQAAGQETLRERSCAARPPSGRGLPLRAPRLCPAGALRADARRRQRRAAPTGAPPAQTQGPGLQTMERRDRTATHPADPARAACSCARMGLGFSRRYPRGSRPRPAAVHMPNLPFPRRSQRRGRAVHEASWLCASWWRSWLTQISAPVSTPSSAALATMDCSVCGGSFGSLASIQQYCVSGPRTSAQR